MAGDRPKRARYRSAHGPADNVAYDVADRVADDLAEYISRHIADDTSNSAIDSVSKGPAQVSSDTHVCVSLLTHYLPPVTAYCDANDLS